MQSTFMVRLVAIYNGTFFKLFALLNKKTEVCRVQQCLHLPLSSVLAEGATISSVGRKGNEDKTIMKLGK